MRCSAVTANLSATQRHAYTQTPSPDFFDSFQTAYEQLQASTAADSSSLAEILGNTQTEMAEIRGVSEADQREYATILHEAYAQEGLDNPQQFLKSLSNRDLDVVRRMHGLADSINASTLSDEGASNLLLPEGYSVDLNADGIDEVGAGKTLHFPPRDAPAEFTSAWFEATKDLDFGDYATSAMTFLVAFHPPTEVGSAACGLPSGDLASYQTVVDNYLSMLDHYRGMLAEGQYERDYPFFSRLQELLHAA